MNSWAATFTWQWSSAANSPGDGFMFAVQTNGLNALGYGGSSKGYVDATGTRTHNGTVLTVPVNPSFGVGIENANLPSELDVGINGAFVQSGTAAAVPNSTLNTQTDTNPINFTIGYNATNNVVNIQAVDSTNPTESFSYNYTLPSSDASLASLLGANTAYVGFTGATGGVSEEQNFTNFNFTTAVPEPASLAMLSLGGAACLLLVSRRRRGT